MKNFQNKFSAILLFAVMALFVSCTEDYQSDIDSLEDRVTALETEVDALQSALDSGAVITSVTNSNGVTTVTLSDNTSFQIKDGADGDAGAPGAAAPVWTIDDEGYWCEDGVQTDVKAVADEANYYTPEFDEDTMMWSWVEYDAEGEATGETIAMESVPAAVWTDGSLVIYGYNEETGAMETFEFSVFSEIKSISYIPELFVNAIETVEAFSLHSNVYTTMDPTSLGRFLTTNLFDLEYQVNPSEASTDAFTFGFSSINVTSRAAGTGVLDVYTATRNDDGNLVVAADSDEVLDWLYENDEDADSTVDMFALQATAKEGYVAETVTSDDYLQVSMTDLYGFSITGPKDYEDVANADSVYEAYVEKLLNDALDELGPCPYIWGDELYSSKTSQTWDTAYLKILGVTNLDAYIGTGRILIISGTNVVNNALNQASYPYSFATELAAYKAANPTYENLVIGDYYATSASAAGATASKYVELVYNESIDLNDYVETWWLGEEFMTGATGGAYDGKYTDQYGDGTFSFTNPDLDPMEVGTTSDVALKVRTLSYTFELEEDTFTSTASGVTADQNDYVVLSGTDNSILSVNSKYGLAAIDKYPVVTVYAYVNGNTQPIAKAYITLDILAASKDKRSSYIYEAFEFDYVYSDIYAIDYKSTYNASVLSDDFLAELTAAGISYNTSKKISDTTNSAISNTEVLLDWSDASALINAINTEVDADGTAYVATDLLAADFDDYYTTTELQYYNTKTGKWVTTSSVTGLVCTAVTGLDGTDAVASNDGAVTVTVDKAILGVNEGTVDYRIVYVLDDSTNEDIIYTYPSEIIIPFSITVTQPIEPFAYNNTAAYVADDLSTQDSTDTTLLTETGDATNNYFAYGDVYGMFNGTDYDMSANAEELFSNKFEDAADDIFYGDCSFVLYPDKDADSNALSDAYYDKDTMTYTMIDDNLDAAGYAITEYYYNHNYFESTSVTGSTYADNTNIKYVGSALISDYQVAYLSSYITLANGQVFKTQDFALVFRNPYYMEVEDVTLYSVSASAGTTNFTKYGVALASGIYSLDAAEDTTFTTAEDTDYAPVKAIIYDKKGKALYGYGAVNDDRVNVTSYAGTEYGYEAGDFVISYGTFVKESTNFGADVSQTLTNCVFNGYSSNTNKILLLGWAKQGIGNSLDMTGSQTIYYSIDGMFKVSATAGVTVRPSTIDKETELAEIAAAEAEANKETEDEE